MAGAALAFAFAFGFGEFAGLEVFAALVATSFCARAVIARLKIASLNNFMAAFAAIVAASASIGR